MQEVVGKIESYLKNGKTEPSLIYLIQGPVKEGISRLAPIQTVGVKFTLCKGDRHRETETGMTIAFIFASVYGRFIGHGVVCT